jgi:tryptophan synthase alpha chain
MTTQKCFDFVSENIDKNLSVSKVLIMTYYNIVLNYGVEAFIKKATDIGVYGFIIPDIPFDEQDGKKIRLLCKKHGVVFTEIISPITPNHRLEQIAQGKPHLLYAISQNMTTGSRAKFDQDFVEYIHNLREYFDCEI